MTKIKALEKLRECANHESAGFFVNLEQAFGLSRYRCGGSTIKPSGAMILNAIADEIEAEIDERFMELPLDADGVPIHVGDKLECHANGYDGAFTVFAIGRDTVIGNHDIEWVRNNPSKWFHVADFCHHVNPRTLEDVLREFANKKIRIHRELNEYSTSADEDVIAKYADEIRELMKEACDD